MAIGRLKDNSASLASWFCFPAALWRLTDVKHVGRTVFKNIGSYS